MPHSTGRAKVAAVSDTAISGSLPMSSATTASITCTELRFRLRVDLSDWRMPVTTIVLLSSAAVAAVDVAGVPAVAAASAAAFAGGSDGSAVTGAVVVCANAIDENEGPVQIHYNAKSKQDASKPPPVFGPRRGRYERHK